MKKKVKAGNPLVSNAPPVPFPTAAPAAITIPQAMPRPRRRAPLPAAGAALASAESVGHPAAGLPADLPGSDPVPYYPPTPGSIQATTTYAPSEPVANPGAGGGGAAGSSGLSWGLALGGLALLWLAMKKR